MANGVRSGADQQPQVQQTQQTMPQTSGNLGLKRQSSGDVSLLFSPSLDDQILDQLGGEESSSYEPTLEVQRIKLSSVLSSDAERKLSQAVQEAKACSILQTGTFDLTTVGRYLRSKYGYLVYLRHANTQRRARTYLRMLRHDFLVVRGVEGAEGADLLVDLNFRDNFVLPHTTVWYSKLVAALPQDWLGTAAKLTPVIELMSAAIRFCFKQVGVPLPPWREARAVLSKWLCEVYVDEPLPLVPLPDTTLRRMLAPYHKPFRAAINSAAIWPEQQQQLGPAAPGQQQRQQQGAAARVPLLPPLPRPPSSVALATSAIRAAAADAAGAVLVGSHAAHRVVGHSAILTADVPRKIIVGFPDQHSKVEQRQQPQQQQQQPGDTAAQPPADADVYLQRHQQQPACKQQQQWQRDTRRGRPPDKPAAAAVQAQHVVAVQAAARQATTRTAAAPTTAAAPAGPDEETVRNGKYTGGLKALPQLKPSSTAAAVAERTAAAPAAATKPVQSVVPGPAGCEAYVKVVVAAAGGSKAEACRASDEGQQRQQQAQQPARKADSPVFSTCGVVTAANPASPAVVVNNQLLQPHMMTGTGAAASLTAGAAAAAGVRQFKPLDQLLPKMKVIKLGC